MPIYEYRCQDCGQVIEVIHGVDATAPTTCDVCGGPLRKMVSTPAIVFKGSGWAKTDARAASSKAAASRAEKDKAATGAAAGAATTGGAETKETSTGSKETSTASSGPSAGSKESSAGSTDGPATRKAASGGD